MDKSDFVCSFLDAHNNACAYCDGWSSPVGDRIDDCADDRRHHRLRVHRRAHLPCRRSDVRTEARPGATGQAGTYEISWAYLRHSDAVVGQHFIDLALQATGMRSHQPANELTIFEDHQCRNSLNAEVGS